MMGMIPDASLSVTRTDSALWFALSLHWPVFPCRAGGKEPATRHGFRDATCDPGQIRAWFGRNPDLNIGIATGAPGPDVLDVDVHEGGDGWAALGKLRDAGLLGGASMAVRTRSGGLHLYYAGTSQRCRSKPAHHLDFRSQGGYVLAPPSEIREEDSIASYVITEICDEPGFEPAVLDWSKVEKLLDPPKARAEARTGVPGDTSALARWVASVPEGGRNSGLFWAACRAAEQGGNPEELVEAAVAAGLGESEARRTVASARKKVTHD